MHAHPKFTSKVLRPFPAILGFMAASAGCLAQMIEVAHQEKERLTNKTYEANPS